jgi:DNA sulfur modification protein DndC
MLEIKDNILSDKIQKSFNIFNSLDPNIKYSIMFSGGKDSHALVAVYLMWKEAFEKSLDIEIIFADTMLEVPSLYEIINKMETFLQEKKVIFKKVTSKKSYWYYQFGIGYAVPDHRIRWCTSRLKIDVIGKKRFPITGRHYGESKARDIRLGCNSGECGVDKVKKSVDPIIDFTNCDVWDFLFYCDDTVLYNGVFNSLKSTYKNSVDEKGSLRMGCLMCPVVGKNTLKSDPRKGRLIGVPVRLVLETLRKGIRLRSPKTKKDGAIFIEDRRRCWDLLDRKTLIENGYMTLEDEKLITEMLEIGVYPKSYSKEWIELEHERIKHLPIQLEIW